MQMTSAMTGIGRVNCGQDEASPQSVEEALRRSGIGAIENVMRVAAECGVSEVTFEVRGSSPSTRYVHAMVGSFPVTMPIHVWPYVRICLVP